MKKQTFLKLCGERDRAIAEGMKKGSFEDLLRLGRIADLLGCIEVNLEMYITGCREYPKKSAAYEKVDGCALDALELEEKWCMEFYQNAPSVHASKKLKSRLHIELEKI